MTAKQDLVILTAAQPKAREAQDLYVSLTKNREINRQRGGDNAVSFFERLFPFFLYYGIILSIYTKMDWRNH